MTRMHMIAYHLAMLLTVLLQGGVTDQLKLTNAFVTPGTEARIPIVLTTSHPTVSAISWRVSISGQLPFHVVPLAKGKTVRCVMTRCILYGGQTPLGNGTIATLIVDIPDVQTLPIHIAVDSVLGATSEGDEVTIQGGPTEFDRQPGH